MKYYLQFDGAQQGPFSWLQVTNLWTSGRITSSTLIWTGSEDEWTEIGDWVEDNMHAYAAAANPPRRVERWGDNTFFLLSIVAFFLPPIGILIALSGIFEADKRAQAGKLLVVSLVAPALFLLIAIL